MRFNKLRLLGFKSFVEPTEFVIEPGLTGVVGPNGCGKSNLVEALRWVMGENSYKNMRASGMDDVIFSGSGTRPSRNTAEVALFLNNSDRTAPAAWNDQDELQVSRRIEREAGSVYRINGKDARAKDVQLLFADQSTGARSPSMVGQGRIGELIQAKPQARRALLEEAAGISGLHSRRHEAELRLRAAETNLERLDDLTGELESQIESLRRQARQAIRFKTLSAEIRQAEATLLHVRWTLAKAQEGAAESELAQATNAVAAQAQRQMEAAKDQAVGAHHLPQLRDGEARAAAALQRLTIARTQIEDEAKRIKTRADELRARIAQIDADILREGQIVADNADVIARLASEAETLQRDSADATKREAETRSAFEIATAKLSAAETALNAVTSERAEAAAATQSAERAVRDATVSRDRFAQQLASADGEITAISDRIGALADPSEKRALLEAASGRLSALEATAASAETALTEARQREAGLRTPVQEAKTALNRAETEARTLAKVLNAGKVGLFPAVVEKIHVDKGYETALGAALGEDLDIPLDRAAPAYWSDNAVDPSDPQLPDGVTALSSVVRAPAQLARRLAQIGIVDAAKGAALQTLLAPGQRLVTRDGALWRWDGYVASADAPTPAALRLAQKNRLRELEAEVADATRSLRSREADHRDAEQALASATTGERSARDAVRAAQADVLRARDALAAAERAAGELVARRDALKEGHARLADNLHSASATLAAAEATWAQRPDMAAVSARFSALTSDVAADRSALAEARAAHDALTREAEARHRRLAMIATEREQWTKRAANADSQITALQQRHAAASAELETIADAPDEIEARRRDLMSALAVAEKDRNAAADALQAAENKQRDRDKSATDAIQALASARETRARSEERLTAARERREAAEARISEALNCPPHLVIRQTGLAADAAMPSEQDIERKFERLKIERERLGAVNLRAEEEQAELSERLETIIRERDDIIEAIRTLRQAIQGLNAEGRERLLVAFDDVNTHFQRLFTHLFGGGTAELQLIENDDPLEAGLEILARPPGKRPQTMTLLSGGEQALTAMALIFAVFLTNPAPICVLDEVDAPLDDHNVERFCNLMDAMANDTDTRFVIITHNPITMARMNRLFGVTMAEQGVSQLVSVDLQQAEELREAG
jgi:chromosome segregation protein